MFKKILDYVKNLFANKKQNSDTAPIAVEEPVATQSVPCKKEEVIDEKSNIEYAEISNDDRAVIVDLLRPIVKGFNSDDAYTAACEAIQSKLLKTYSSLSDDKKDLIIKLTLSDKFNKEVGEFIANHVAPSFKAAIDAENFGKYEISAENGEIHIKKIS